MKALATLALLLSGCAHSPDPTFFALSARDGAATETARPLKIELRRTVLPGYLDRPHIVRRSTAEQLELGGDERWGAPLDEMVGATLAEDLAQRLPTCVVYTDSGAISAVPDVRVEVQLFRFERLANGDVTLLAEAAVHWAGTDASSTQRFALKQRTVSGQTSEIVTSLSQLLGKLADGISSMILRQAAAAPTNAVGAATP